MAKNIISSQLGTEISPFAEMEGRPPNDLEHQNFELPLGACHQAECTATKETPSGMTARWLFVGESMTWAVTLVVMLGLLFLFKSSPMATLDHLIHILPILTSLIEKYSPADPKVQHTASELLQQSNEEGDEFKQGISLLQLHRNANFKAQHLLALKYGEQIESLPQATLDAGLRTWALFSKGESLFFLGKLPESYQQTTQGLLSYSPAQQIGLVSAVGTDAKVSHLAYEGLTQWLLGYPDQALRTSTEGLIWARQINHPYNIAFALNMRALLYHLRGDVKESLQDATSAISISSRGQGFPFYLAMGTILQGRASINAESPEESIRRIKEGLQIRPPQAGIAQTYFHTLLAEAYEIAGMREAGIEALNIAQRSVDETEERVIEADINRLRGELLRRIHPLDKEAEQYFQKALSIARAQGAVSLELRAAMSLARLWQEQGKKDAAQHLLAETYGKFSEGFETKDLRDAKQLLTALF